MNLKKSKLLISKHLICFNHNLLVEMTFIPSQGRKAQLIGDDVDVEISGYPGFAPVVAK